VIQEATATMAGVGNASFVDTNGEGSRTNKLITIEE